MLRMLKFVGLLMMLSTAARAQDVLIHAVNGQTGEPLAGQKVIVFVFDKLPNPRTKRFVLVADEKGVAVLPSADVTGKYLQAYVRGSTPCLEHPDDVKLAVDRIRDRGLSGDNSCSLNVGFRTKANELYVYARFAKYGVNSAD